MYAIVVDIAKKDKLFRFNQLWSNITPQEKINLKETGSNLLKTSQDSHTYGEWQKYPYCPIIMSITDFLLQDTDVHFQVSLP